MKYAYDKAARTIRIVPSVDLNRDVVTVEIRRLTMMEMGWTTIADIDKALGNRIASRNTAGQAGIARAVARLNSADRGFMPCAARYRP